MSTLRGSARPSSPTHGSSVVQRIITRTASKSFIGSTPGEYMTYLLRSDNSKEDRCLPVMDLYGLVVGWQPLQFTIIVHINYMYMYNTCTSK